MSVIIQSNYIIASCQAKLNEKKIRYKVDTLPRYNGIPYSCPRYDNNILSNSSSSDDIITRSLIGREVD